jgi:hypothetical protein
MKKIIVVAIAALLFTSISTAYAAPDTPEDHKPFPHVAVCFQTGIGITLLVTNPMDETVSNVTLDTDILEISGGPMVVARPGRTTAQEVPPGDSTSLNMFSFGVPGIYTVTSSISFKIEERTVTQPVHCQVFMLGFVTMPL